MHKQLQILKINVAPIVEDFCFFCFVNDINVSALGNTQDGVNMCLTLHQDIWMTYSISAILLLKIYPIESQLNKEFSFDTESQFQIKNCQYQMTISNI